VLAGTAAEGVADPQASLGGVSLALRFIETTDPSFFRIVDAVPAQDMLHLSDKTHREPPISRITC
jgi:hypothetical protein